MARRETRSTWLVTGGAGFVGSHLVDALLARGDAVRVLDDFSTGRAERLDPRCEVLRGDVADAGLLRHGMQGVAGCFHLAAVASVARSLEDWPGTHRINAGGTVAVLDAARDLGRVPVVYASSAAVYGDLGGAVARESLRCVPLTAYAADKVANEMHAAVAFGIFGVPTFGLRFFNIYGPRQDAASPYAGVVARFAHGVAAGEALSIHGDGLQVRDLVYVGDAVAHLLAAMALLRRTPQAGVANVCTGVPTTVVGLATVVGRVVGHRPVLRHAAARAGDIRHSLGDPSHAVATLGLRATTTLEDGLCATLGR